MTNFNPAFPNIRLRRTRMNEWSRKLLAENHLRASDLILPIFIQEGTNIKTPIESLPDVYRVTLDILVEQVKEARDFGIRAVSLFPYIEPSLKSPYGDEGLFNENLVCRAIAAIKENVPDIGVIADIALDPYTTHGQDGIIENGKIDNDLTIKQLCKQALVMAQAGCDIVAPSDMMDGRVGAIRKNLERHSFADTIILSYSAKYSSSMYAPFRDAVGSKAQLGKADKSSYQMDCANSIEAMREIELDIAEGADIVMVKPAISYLDIISKASSNFTVPIFAYQVSGEYSMIKAAHERGFIDGDAVMLEQLLAIKRAGARAIFTYAALEVAKKII